MQSPQQPQRQVSKYLVPIATATITDLDGNHIYRVVPTTWARLISVGYGVLLFAIIVLTVLIYNNNRQINQLEHKVEGLEEINNDVRP